MYRWPHNLQTWRTCRSMFFIVKKRAVRKKRKLSDFAWTILFLYHAENRAEICRDLVLDVLTLMASGINIYSQLLISLIRIVDINISNYWYQQFELLISAIHAKCWYQQFELLISVIRITDISNSNCWYQQLWTCISREYVSKT